MAAVLLKTNRSELLYFVAEMVKATSDTSQSNGIDPATITSKLLAMSYDAIVDLHTRLKFFLEFPDTNYRFTERLRDAELM